MDISDDMLDPRTSAAASEGYEALSAAQEADRPYWDDFQCTYSIPAEALQLERGAACDCVGTEGEQAGWRHRSS